MKRLLIALTGVSAMLLGSCAQEIGGDNGKVDPIGPNMLRLTVDVEDRSGHSANGDTRAVTAIAEEKTINDLYLLFFEPSADKNGQFVDYVKAGEGHVLPYEGGFRASIDMSDTQLDVKAAYNILAIANIENFTSDAVRYLGGDADDSDKAETNTAVWMQQWSGKTQKQVIAEAQAITAAGRVQSDQLLMSGMTSKAANDFNPDVTLLRNQIRFDVENRDTDYELVEVYLKNAYGTSKIWNDGSIGGALNYGQDVSRIRDYYDDEGGAFVDVTPAGEKIVNHFYVFENTVAQPVQNDAFTTCVIVGLQPTAGGATEFFRINILPENQAQILYRNHAYVLTVNSVIGEGAGTVNEAYREADAPELNYIINQWNEDEVGVSDQDGNSMLSSPYKTVNLELSTGDIRGRAELGLPAREFNITTVTSLPAGSFSPIEIIGTPKFYLNGKDPYPYYNTGVIPGMHISLNTQTAGKPKLRIDLQTAVNGNTVHIVPTDGRAPYDHKLKAEDRITGQITLGYAGLRITIDVVQTDITPPVLNVYPPAGGLGNFAPFAGIVSEPIRVDASRQWKATILSEDPGTFEFADADVDPDTGDITRDPSTPGYNNELTVKTALPNGDADRAHVAFVVVSLLNDQGKVDVNYSRAIQVTQAQKAEIAIAPSSATVTFDGTYDPDGASVPASDGGDGLNGALAAVPNNDRHTFNVMPGTNGEGASELQNDWRHVIQVWEPSGSGQVGAGSWEAVYWGEAGAGHASGDVAGKPHWFSVVAAKSTTVGAPNTFKVDVSGANNLGTTRYARLVVFIGDTDPNSTTTAKAYINLVQQSSGMSLSPSSVPAVAKTGGVTPEVTVDSDASLKWKITNITPSYTVSGRSGVTAAVNHPIEVFLGNDNVMATGTSIASVNGTAVTNPGDTYPVSQTFKVRFPKIYYPNRQIGMSVKLEITLCENDDTPTQQKKEITFTQSALTSPGFYPYAPQTAGYGNIYGGAANHRYIIALRAAEKAYPTTSLTVNSNYMHMNYESLSANYDWAAVKTFRSQRDGLLIVNNDLDYFPHLPMLNNENSVLYASGYVIEAANGNGAYHNAVVPNTDSDTKVYQMIIEGAGGGMNHTGTMNQTLTKMWVDDVSTCVTTRPPSAVALIAGGDNGQVLMTVDPKNNIIYQGESQVFDTVQGNWLLESLMVYIKNAAMWGSAFTDLMVEDDQLTVAEGKAGVTVGNHPAPWDASWGANKGIQ